MNEAATITIYGARGSLPNTSRDTWKYGGATTCLAVDRRAGGPIVFDAGTGIADYGRKLAQMNITEREAHLFFTHTHWDHMLGLPFFTPLYDPEWTIHIYSLNRRTASPEQAFTALFRSPNFPVPYEALEARLVFHELGFDDTIEIDDTTVRCCRVNHPGYALGFRLERAGRCFFFASDAAPFDDILFEDGFHEPRRESSPDVMARMREYDQIMRDAIRGSQYLFFDSNFTDEEYARFFHFGHSSMSHAYQLAHDCGVPHVIFWHHDRARTDRELEALVAPYVERGQADGLKVELAQVLRQYDL